MTIDTLERVMWRLRSKNKGKAVYTDEELHRAIMVECGTCDRTFASNKKSLKKLGWITIEKDGDVFLTDKDLSGDY